VESEGGGSKTWAGASGSRWLTPCGCWLYCRSVEGCVEEMLRDYKREVEKMKEPSLHITRLRSFCGSAQS